MQPPAQELIARDLHDNVWTFRHIYRGMFSLQPFESLAVEPLTLSLPIIIMFSLSFHFSTSASNSWFPFTPGQPKRHLLTTGWSLFVSGKRLFAGDSVLFIR